MKKILVLTAAFFVLAVCKADAYTATRLQVHSYDNAPIQIYIDGNAYGNATAYQNLENLAPGNHEMQVTELVTDENNNTSEQVVFTGNVRLDQGYALNTVVNPGNNLQVINEVAIYEPQYAPQYAPIVAVNFHPYVVCGVGFRGRYYHAPAVCYVRPHYSVYRAPVVAYGNRGWGGGYERGYHGNVGYHGNAGYRGGGYHEAHYSHNGRR